jgi:hypothetical protein
MPIPKNADKTAAFDSFLNIGAHHPMFRQLRDGKLKRADVVAWQVVACLLHHDIGKQFH